MNRRAFLRGFSTVGLIASSGCSGLLGGQQQQKYQIGDFAVVNYTTVERSFTIRVSDSDEVLYQDEFLLPGDDEDTESTDNVEYLPASKFEEKRPYLIGIKDQKTGKTGERRHEEDKTTMNVIAGIEPGVQEPVPFIGFYEGPLR